MGFTGRRRLRWVKPSFPVPRRVDTARRGWAEGSRQRPAAAAHRRSASGCPTRCRRRREHGRGEGSCGSSPRQWQKQGAVATNNERAQQQLEEGADVGGQPAPACGGSGRRAAAAAGARLYTSLPQRAAAATGVRRHWGWRQPLFTSCEQWPQQRRRVGRAASGCDGRGGTRDAYEGKVLSYLRARERQQGGPQRHARRSSSC